VREPKADQIPPAFRHFVEQRLGGVIRRVEQHRLLRSFIRDHKAIRRRDPAGIHENLHNLRAFVPACLRAYYVPPMMDAAISKAQALVEALSYIQRFHDKVIVVKVGGSIMDDETALAAILTDIVFMNYVGMSPILVHGGGKAINAAMEQAGLVPQMVQGRRYTDERTLAIAEHVLCNQINKFIVNFVQSQGCEAMGLHSLTRNVLFAEKTYVEGRAAERQRRHGCWRDRGCHEGGEDRGGLRYARHPQGSEGPEHARQPRDR